jgi:N-acyl-D-aspartate/D-glutamate deacylase
MNNKLLLLIAAILLVASGYFFMNDSNEITQEENEPNVNQEGNEKDNGNISFETLDVVGITLNAENVYALVNENGVTDVYTGEQNGLSIQNLTKINSLSISAEKEYTGIEVDQGNNTLYLFGTKSSGENFIDAYDLETNSLTAEQLIEGNEKLSNISYKSGYMEGMFYAKTNHDELKAEVILNTLTFDSHMDLLVIDMPSKKAYISWINVTEDIESVVYTITEGNTNTTYIHKLATNETKKVDESNKVAKFIFSDKLLYRIAVEQPKDGFETTEVPYTYAMENETHDESVYDVVIKNGIVVDPETETMMFGYNVGIIGDEIAKITKEEINGVKEIDATHKIVSPGFIDMLSFNPNLMAAKFKIGDGVTTNLSMHGGTADFDNFFSQYTRYPTLVNVGGSLYAIRLRYEQGLGNHGTPTQAQIDKMVKRAREEIEKGALAVSFSPEYYPGTTSEEIKAIMKVAKEYGIPTHFHGRYSAITGKFTSIDTVKEVLGYVRELDAPVHFMHLHSTGGTGAMDEAIAMIEQARAEGYQVTYDIYAYDSWATNIAFERMSGDWQTRFGITYSDIQVAGTTERLTEETFKEMRQKGGIIIVHAMDEEEVIQAMKVPHSMIGSDSIIDIVKEHPRGAGNFARFLGRYVRDKDIVPFMLGLQKVTYLNAKHLEGFTPSMQTRGRINVGATADITIFDYNEIIDTATPENPASYSAGIDYVLVSGKIIKDHDTIYDNIRNGQIIKAEFE